MNMRRLRELEKQFLDKYTVDTMVIDMFLKFVKEKEKERRAAEAMEFKPDPTPMIGTNPFRRDEPVCDGDHLAIPPTRDAHEADTRFNRLLNYRVEGLD